MISNKKCLVIIPVYNGEKYLPSLLVSLEQAYLVYSNFSVLFVDDQSSDLSCKLISSAINDWLELKINQEKKYFVGSCNFGLNQALAENYEYAFLLNQDTEITPEVLPQLIKKMDAEPDLGALQPLIRLHPQIDLLNSRGCAIHIFGLGYTIGHRTLFNKELAVAVPTAYCSGAAVLYRLSALKKIGLLAERYQMYHEDLEIGWRLWLNGWRCACYTGAWIYHKHQFSRSIKRVYFMERNRWLFILSRYSARTLLLLAPGLFVFEIILCLFAIKNGWILEKIRTYKYFLIASTWNYIKSERSKMKKLRHLPDSKLIDLLTEKIEYQDLGKNWVISFGNKLIGLYWLIVKPLIKL
jgi:GT2 family glycosyltransferase